MTTGEFAIESSPEDINRRKPLLPPPRDRKRSNVVGECAGSTAAECAAVCCCCPFVVAEVVFIAVYKLPTAICRRIWRKGLTRRKKKMKMKGNNTSGRMSTIHSFDDDGSRGDVAVVVDDRRELETVKAAIDGSDLDREMWERFDSTGFGRSLSQRHTVW